MLPFFDEMIAFFESFPGTPSLRTPWVPWDVSWIMDQSLCHKSGSFSRHVCGTNGSCHFTNFHFGHSGTIGRHLVPVAPSFFSMRNWSFWKSGKCRKFTGSTICSETLYFVDCESADGRSEKILGSNERYIH